MLELLWISLDHDDICSLFTGALFREGKIMSCVLYNTKTEFSKYAVVLIILSQAVVVHTSNPSTWEAEADGSL